MIPRWSFSALLVTAALLPWYVVRWQIAGIPTTLLEVAILLTIGMWAAEKTIRREWQGFLAFVRQKRIFFGLIALFVVSACIEAFISPSHREALGILKAYILEPVLFLLVAVDSISVNPKGWWWLVGALWLAGLQVMLVSVSQTLWHWPNLAPAELAQGRASSFYNTANAVGLFLGPLLGLAIGALLSGQLKRWTMMLLTLWAGLGLLVIGLSHSRGAFLGCAAVAAVFGSAWVIRRSGLTMSSKTTRSLAIGMVILYAALSLGYVWFVNNPPKVANPYTRPGFSTLTVRQCLWQGTKNLLDDSPLLGAGLSGFSAAISRVTNATLIGIDATS